MLENINWHQFLPSNAPNESCNIFKKVFPDFYYVAFQKKEIEIKSKHINTPWITKDQRKSSKRKQCLYGKYLKIRSKENKTDKTYETFEKIKTQAKKNYYRNNIKLFEKTCKIQGKS